MTKGEHTNERTYVHTYGTDPISPPQLCCARDNNLTGTLFKLQPHTHTSFIERGWAA